MTHKMIFSSVIGLLANFTCLIFFHTESSILANMLIITFLLQSLHVIAAINLRDTYPGSKNNRHVLKPRAAHTVLDIVKIRKTVTEPVDIHCLGLNENNPIELEAWETKKFSRSREIYEEYALCCKFKWRELSIPNPHPVYDDHYPLATLTENVVPVEIVITSSSVQTKVGQATYVVAWGQSYYKTCREANHVTPPPGTTQFDARTGSLRSHLGYKCLSECRADGDSQEWCYLEYDPLRDRKSWAWDYCTGQVDVSTHSNFGIVSSYGMPCSSKCENKMFQSVYTCTTTRKYKLKHAEGVFDYDYCSPAPGVDYMNRKCNSKCGYHMGNYKWCTVQGGSWGYCGNTPELEQQNQRGGSQPSSRFPVTSHGLTCTTSCAKEGSTSYFWCKTEGIHDWDYCSPIKSKDYKGNQCTSKCDYSGEKFKWCYIQGDSWGYCSS